MAGRVDIIEGFICSFYLLSFAPFFHALGTGHIYAFASLCLQFVGVQAFVLLVLVAICFEFFVLGLFQGLFIVVAD